MPWTHQDSRPLTCAVGGCTRPGPVGGAVPRGQPRGPVAVPAGVDHGAGEQDAVAADDHAVGGRPRVPTGHGCEGTEPGRTERPVTT